MAKPAPNANRLPDRGALIDRSKPVSFKLNGETLTGYEGDTLASALIANGRRFIGRSFKYHRPRGFVASGVEEPNGLFGVGEGGAFEPNQRGTMVELHPGLTARTQNHFPTLEYDLGSMNALMSRMFPAGFYYKTFIRPRRAWKHVFEPIIRQAAGLGKAPTQPDDATYEQLYYRCDVLVAGGGPAGLMAAKAAAQAGARVLLVEQSSWLGGRALVDDAEVDGRPIAEWVRDEIAALRAMPNVTIRTRTQASALTEHNYVLCAERVADHDPAQVAAGAPRQRLWRVRAGRVVVAAGAIERPLAFACNDVPGVMLASAVRDYVTLYGVKPGDRVVIYANNDDAYRTAVTLREAGVEVPAILDARDGSNGDLPQRARQLGLRMLFGAGVARALGGKQVEAVEVAELRSSGRVGAMETVACDCVAMSGGWSPTAHLYSHTGGKLAWDEAHLMFRPDPARAPIGPDGAACVDVAGRANGHLNWRDVIADGLVSGAEAASALGFHADAPPSPDVACAREDRIEPLWFTPAPGKFSIGSKHFLDFQNDVTAADVELAAREGYESVEHAKRYTTLGMATDQGKLSNVNGLAILADAQRKSIPEVGHTTFRPPYTPLALGAIAGAQRGDLFKPVRETAIHGWHAAQGAVFEPVGDWRRPYCYPRAKEGGRESREEAVNREILTAREKVGLLDASTLGKIVVSGPDAGVFLDRLYTNMLSTLKPGRCRYALMCDDNGYLFDDGVVVRLSEDSFLCHTTSGGADRVHGWMEEWLQTEWPDLRVFITNATEAYAQIAVVGPHARDLLARLESDVDLSDAGLPFMTFQEGEIAGAPARIHRISFSGELSYEIATPASRGLALWEALLEAGAPFGAAPYGTEALHVMRAEVGFIMIGDETDGTVTPNDLDLGWALSKKKADFVGKRAIARPFLSDPARWRLVGLETEDPSEVLPDGAYAVDQVARSGPMKTIGRVTSSYWSPTLKRSIAMGLVARGPERMGETLSFPVDDKGVVIRAKIVAPRFHEAAPPATAAEAEPCPARAEPARAALGEAEAQAPAGRGVAIAQAPLMGMLTLKADLGDAAAAEALERRLGLAMPERRRVSEADGRRAVWMAPDELLLLCDRARVSETRAALEAAFMTAERQIVDMSDARQLFTLEGARARETLAKGAPVDLHPSAFGLGDARRTRIGPVAAGFWQAGAEPDRFELVCYRSYAPYFWRWLCEAGRETAAADAFGSAA